MKHKTKTRGRRGFFKAVLLALLAACLFILPFSWKDGGVTATAQVRSNDSIKIEKYHVEMDIREDRKVEVTEWITVTFLKSGLSMFYRSLPIETARYENISAKCEGNDKFSYYVEDNPDMSGFFDINCVGNAGKGKTWTYEISYTMENGLGAGSSRDGMNIDVIPFGFTVDLHNVSAEVRFPYAVAAENCILRRGYGSTKEDTALNKKISDDGKTLTFSKDVLSVNYNETFDEEVADGVSVEFTFTDGKFKSYTATRLFTDGIWKVLLIGLGFAAFSVGVLVFTRKKRDIVTTVNITAPDNMSPVEMGKLLDGTVDNEDITSMIYYFAHKGYLTIDLSDEDDPKLNRQISELPDDAEAYEVTLFEGLFRNDNIVAVSELQYKFYEDVEKAKMQLPHVKMYEKKSVFGYLLGGIFAVLSAFVSMWILASARLGNGYSYGVSLAFAIPVAAILLIGYISENYRYKWKKGALFGIRLVQLAVAVLFTLIFTFAFANHFSTEYEKLAVSLLAFACTFITQRAISRREDYLETLGQILGFKDFIVYTEEDKIKAMLEENPELYYKVLPYAQVLGVTNEWEKKFENILIEPPQWCRGSHMTVFDYMILNRCMTRAMILAMARPQPKGGGSFIGRSGGGGSFGGFGGGGFGGGGGGAR
ncbi:MAG: DUF2207 domain-containing protein [Clostridia bacterium]|nr:DUF2207 domain-containing protein [Clostridia bacterium]